MIEKADINIGREFLIPPNIVVKEATAQQPIVYVPPSADYVAAIIPLPNFEDTYLFVARPIDPRVIQYLRQTEANLVEYRGLEQRRFGVQIAFALMYAVIAMILLLSSIWIGLNFANRLVAPSAPDHRGRPGRFRQSLCTGAGASVRGRSRQSRRQLQQDDRRASRAKRRSGPRPRPDDERRRFSEAVLSGVGAA